VLSVLAKLLESNLRLSCSLGFPTQASLLKKGGCSVNPVRRYLSLLTGFAFVGSLVL